MQEFAGRRTQRGLRTGIFSKPNTQYQRLWGSNAPQDCAGYLLHLLSFDCCEKIRRRPTSGGAQRHCFRAAVQ
jgi:hypothetical protein